MRPSLCVARNKHTRTARNTLTARNTPTARPGTNPRTEPPDAAAGGPDAAPRSLRRSPPRRRGRAGRPFPSVRAARDREESHSTARRRGGGTRGAARPRRAGRPSPPLSLRRAGDRRARLNRTPSVAACRRKKRVHASRPTPSQRAGVGATRGPHPPQGSHAGRSQFWIATAFRTGGSALPRAQPSARAKTKIVIRRPRPAPHQPLPAARTVQCTPPGDAAPLSPAAFASANCGRGVAPPARHIPGTHGRPPPSQPRQTLMPRAVVHRPPQLPDPPAAARQRAIAPCPAHDARRFLRPGWSRRPPAPRRYFIARPLPPRPPRDDQPTAVKNSAERPR